MATTKTLTPTNQTISIPELTDSPDMSVPADAIDKEADAINALGSKIVWPTLTADLSGVSSVATFKSAYSSVGLYYNAPSSSQRATLVNLGLLPKNYAGLLTVIKYSDTLFYMEYYLRVENSKYFAFIENDTVSSWEQIAVTSEVENIGEVKQLWVNLSGTSSGEIEMNEPITNFNFILLKYRTNGQEKSQLVKSSVSYDIYEEMNLYSTTGLQSDYSYKTTCIIKFTTTKKATVSTAYNNANLILRVMAIYGIGRISS